MKIGIAGCAGRMGQELIKATLAHSAIQLSAGSVSSQSHLREMDIAVIAGLPPCSILPCTHSAELMAASDAVIDFTRPELAVELAQEAAKTGTILVTGTTGLSEAQQHQIERAAQETVIVQSYNMSVGVNLLACLIEQTAALLDDEYDIEILEMHHRYKVDAPSGTALMLGEAAAKGRNVSLEEKRQSTRDGITGERKAGDIGFATLRGGGVIGDHQVIFASLRERIELSHRSSSRAIYAEGALRAAQWAALPQRQAGLYGLRDVLGLGEKPE